MIAPVCMKTKLKYFYDREDYWNKRGGTTDSHQPAVINDNVSNESTNDSSDGKVEGNGRQKTIRLII